MNGRNENAAAWKCPTQAAVAVERPELARPGSGRPRAARRPRPAPATPPNARSAVNVRRVRTSGKAKRSSRPQSDGDVPERRADQRPSVSAIIDHARPRRCRDSSRHSAASVDERDDAAAARWPRSAGAARRRRRRRDRATRARSAPRRPTPPGSRAPRCRRRAGTPPRRSTARNSPKRCAPSASPAPNAPMPIADRRGRARQRRRRRPARSAGEPTACSPPIALQRMRRAGFELEQLADQARARRRWSPTRQRAAASSRRVVDEHRRQPRHVEHGAHRRRRAHDDQRALESPRAACRTSPARRCPPS